MCDSGDQEIPNQDQDTDGINDCDYNPAVGMDVHTFNDFKYYLITLGFAIMTMLLLKLSWKLTKCFSITLINTMDDLSHTLQKRISTSKNTSTSTSTSTNTNTNTNTNLPRVESFRCNKMDAILYRNGTKVRRSQSSTSSLESIPIYNDGKDDSSIASTNTSIPFGRSDSAMSRIEKGVGITSTDTGNAISTTTTTVSDIKDNTIHAFGFVFTYRKVK